MLIRDSSYLELWWPSCSADRSNLKIMAESFMRNTPVKLFEFGSVVKEMLFRDISYLELWWPSCSADPSHLVNFGRGFMREFFVKLLCIWNSG